MSSSSPSSSRAGWAGRGSRVLCDRGAQFSHRRLSQQHRGRACAVPQQHDSRRAQCRPGKHSASLAGRLDVLAMLMLVGRAIETKVLHVVKVVTSQATLPTKYNYLFVCLLGTFTSASKATALGHPSPSLPQFTHPPPLVQGVAILHHLCFHPASPYACFPLPLPLTCFTLLHSALRCPALLYSASRALCITVRACGISFANTVADIFFRRLQQPCRYTTSQPRPLPHTEIKAALPQLLLR
jgi:hypothetical protein